MELAFLHALAPISSKSPQEHPSILIDSNRSKIDGKNFDMMLERREFSNKRDYMSKQYHTMRFKVEQWWKEASIWQAGVQVTKFIEKGMGQGIQLHEIHNN